MAMWAVLVVLYLHADRMGRCNPSVSTIMKVTRLPRRTVTRALAALRDAGIIHRDKSPGKTNAYRLTTRDTDGPTGRDASDTGEDSKLGTPVTASRDDHAPTARDIPVTHVGTLASLKQEEQQQDLNSVLNSGSPQLAAEFEEWWSEYGRIGDRAPASALYGWWRTTGQASADELLTAAVRYRDHCAATTCFMKHGRTFLAKPARGKPPVWPEWAAGEVHGAMDVAAGARLNDVLVAGAQAFGLTGGDNGNGPHAFGQPRSAGAVGRGAPARRGLPQGKLDDGE
jgi:DNA-binding transcriptional ArsR family regulator